MQTLQCLLEIRENEIHKYWVDLKLKFMFF